MNPARALLTIGCLCVFHAVGAIAYAQIVGYWRFEDLKEKMPMIAPDSAGSGNEFRGFNQDASPAISDSVPYQKVPQTGERNSSSSDFTAPPANRMQARDLFLVGSKTNLDPNIDALDQWTLETAVRFKATENWAGKFQTFIGREGYNVPAAGPLMESPLSTLGFKKRGDRNRISIEAWDSENHYVVVESPDDVRADTWYSLAAVSDGKTLSLWIKGPDDREYVMKASKPFAGALKNSRGLWTMGRGFYGNQINEAFVGWLDEVRLTAIALKPEQFLASANDKSKLALALKPATEPAAFGDFGSSKPMSDLLPHPHDPVLIESGGVYHMFASHGGIAHWQSKDLIHWDRLPSTLENPPSWAREEIGNRPGMWAPDVIYAGGKYLLYYSVSTFGSQRSAIVMASNPTLDPKDPKYRWTDQGKVLESFRGDPYNAIDPSLAFDVDGRLWMAWGSFNRGLYLAELDAKTGRLKSDKKDFIHIAARPGNTAIEAPQLFYHDGWYYLFASYDNCCRGAASTYKLLVGRSKKITGPYVDRDGKPMLEGGASLVVRGYDHLRGPGQNSIIKRDDDLLFAHHYYDARNNGVATLALRPMHFDRQGWPLVGEPIGDVPTNQSAQSLAGTWLVLTDDISPRNITVAADGTAQSGSQKGNWKIDKDRITLSWQSTQAGGPPVVEEGFLSSDHASYVARRSDGAIIRGRWQK